MLSREPIDKLGFVNDEGKKYLWQLAQELTFGSVVLFAGAGLSFNAVCRDGGRNRMPSWGGLSSLMRKRLEHDIRPDTDPLKVADYFETTFGRAALVEAVRDAIEDANHVPGRVHQAVARLNFEEIITTNFDTLIERSFRDQFIEPQMIVRSQDLVQRRRPPRILKMNGCIRLNPSEIVITGNDFLSYAETHPWVQVFVTKSFVESTVLFVGFGLNDPAFRAINERVLSMLGRENPRLAFSLQHGISRTEMEFWKARQVQIIDLHSGKSDAADHEDRLYRVLEAFGEVQKEHARNLRSNKQHTTLLASVESETRGTGLAETHQILLGEMLESLGAHLDKATREQIALNQEERFKDLSILLGDCLHRFVRREGRDRDLRCEEVLGEVAARLKEVCRLEDVESPGLELSAAQWFPLRSLAEMLLADGGFKGVGLNQDLGADLRVLTALLNLKLFILAPRFVPAWGASEKERAASRLLQSIGLLELKDLGTQDMQIRSRLVLLLVFFGPMQRVAELVELWAGGRSEEELTGRGAKSRQETPVEYRLLPLSFEGVLQKRQEFFKRAAESLWARHVFKDDPNRGWRIENAFRYQYLRQAAPEEEWAGVRLHTDRLAHVLGQLALQPAPGGDPVASDAVPDLLAVLLELNRGWLFGCRPPEALFRAWDSAEDRHAKQKTGEVPWEALILFSLPILGPALFERWQRLLHEVWQLGHLDTCFLVGHAVQRLGSLGFGRTALKDDAVEDSPAGRYEAGLARLVDWLAERAAFEAEGSPLRQKLATDLLPALTAWLRSMRYPEVRRCLLRSLVSLRALDPGKTGSLVRSWVLARLNGQDQRSSLELAVLDPPPGELAVERNQIQMLLAYAQMPAAKGTSFRNDILKWLVCWAEHGESLDSLTLASLSGQVVEFMTQPGRSAGSSVEWLILAAQVRSCSRLRVSVEERLSRRLRGGSSPRLLELVKKKLAEMPEPNRRQLSAKGVLLASLIPFAEDFDEEMVELLELSLRSPKISPGGRNDAVHLLAALLAKAPEAIRVRYTDPWRDAVRSFLHAGAVGRGLLQEQIQELDGETLRILQANLIAFLEREKEVRPREIVKQLTEKIRLGLAVPLADLEEELVHGIQSPHEALALHCLEAVIELGQDCPDFFDRNQRRIRRIRDLVESLGRYRKPSRFAELLAQLRDLGEKKPAAAPVVEPPRNGRKRGRYRA